MIREEAWGVSSDINVNIIGSKVGEMNPKLTYQLDMMGKDKGRKRNREMKAFMERCIDKHHQSRSPTCPIAVQVPWLFLCNFQLILVQHKSTLTRLST